MSVWFITYVILILVRYGTGEVRTSEKIKVGDIKKSRRRSKWEPSPQAPSDICSRCLPDVNSRSASLIIASGSMGSTWLGQLLHFHPCTNSFRLRHNIKMDGKFRGFNSLQELASIFSDEPVIRENEKWERGPRGVIVSLKEIEHLQKSKPRLRHVNLPPSLKREGIRIIVLTRDPFFWAVSKAKKRSILGPDGSKIAKTLDCKNRHQRGGDSCKGINESYSFSVVPREFFAIVRENEIEQKSALRAGKWLASIFRPDEESRRKSMRVVRYEDLLCRSKTNQGVDVLPPELLKWIGLTKCGNMTKTLEVLTEDIKASIKTSPENPVHSIKNLKELKGWAVSKSKEGDRSESDFHSRRRSASPGESGTADFSTEILGDSKLNSHSYFESFDALLSNRSSIHSQVQLSKNCKMWSSLSDFNGHDKREIYKKEKKVHREGNGIVLPHFDEPKAKSYGGDEDPPKKRRQIPLSRYFYNAFLWLGTWFCFWASASVFVRIVSSNSEQR